jgi:Tfp pilus assembly protein PilF
MTGAAFGQRPFLLSRLSPARFRRPFVSIIEGRVLEPAPTTVASTIPLTLVSLLAATTPGVPGAARSAGAREQASVAAQAVPADPKALVEAAMAHHKEGHFAEAIDEYQRFLEIQPQSVEIRSNLGAALAHEGRYEEAIAQYRLALARDATRTPVRLNLAMALYKAFEIAEAARELETVLGGQRENKTARLLLADCYLRMGQFKKVVSTLAPVEPTAAQDRAVAYLLGMALILDEQPARGQVLIDHILKDGESAEARLLMGVTRLMAMEPAAARDDFARAVELNPGLPSAHASLGQALMQLGDADRALAEFEKELEANPNDYDANLFGGVLLRQRQQYPEAMKRFERALSVRPGSATALYQVGSLHLVRGEIVEAQKALEAVVAAEPKFVEAHVSLATVYYRIKRKEDGDKERAIVKDLNREIQASQPGAKEELGPAYRGDPTPVGLAGPAQPPEDDEERAARVPAPPPSS